MKAQYALWPAAVSEPFNTTLAGGWKAASPLTEPIVYFGHQSLCAASVLSAAARRHNYSSWESFDF